MARCDRRTFLGSCMAGAAGMVLASHTQSQAGTRFVRIRPDIEDLATDPTEFGNFLHAMNKIKDLPATDPNSYAALARIHNSTSVPCEHGSNLFLPWHRALLFYFERALQQSDPPRTSNVMLPFYDFTKLPRPGGQRYPAVFEDSTSILSQVLTDFGWEPSNREDAPISSPFFNPSYFRTLITRNPNWGTSNISTGGSPFGFGGGAKHPVFSRKGALENPSHDDMHDVEIAGQLRFPTTAADDPIFWPFHTFLDLVWHRWQQRWPTAAIEPAGATLLGMPEHKTVADFVKIEDLNYDYPAAAGPDLDPEFLLLAGSFTQLNPRIARGAATGRGRVIGQKSFTVPDDRFKQAVLNVPKFVLANSVNYRGYVFVHPGDVPCFPGSEVFRERYLVDYFALLSMKPMQGMAESRTINLAFNITGAVARAADQMPGTKWMTSVYVVPRSADDGRLLPKGSKKTVVDVRALDQVVESAPLQLEIAR